MLFTFIVLAMYVISSHAIQHVFSFVKKNPLIHLIFNNEP